VAKVFVHQFFVVCSAINGFFMLIFQASYQARLRSLIRFLNLRLNLIYFQLRDHRFWVIFSWI